MMLVVLFLIGVSASLGIPVSEEMRLPLEADPCTYTLCMVNTTCISIPDPRHCFYPPPPQEEPCRKRAMCVPNGPHHYGPVCGVSGEICPPGHSCEFVQVYCITAPCPPLLMCVDRNPPSPHPPSSKSEINVKSMS